MASISGSVTIAGDPDDWIACAFDASTHAFAGVATVSAGAYEITGLTAGKAYVVACRPKTGAVWQADYGNYAEGDYVLPLDTETTPYIFKATSVPPAGDLEWSSTKLLLPFNGTDGATSTTDSSTSAHTITFSGNAQLDTAQSKWGTASLLLDGSGDYVTAAASTDFEFGSDDFTIECWMRWANTNANMGIFTTADNKFYLTIDNNRLYFRVNESENVILQSWTRSSGQWYHLALARDGTTTRVFVDGQVIGSGTSANPSHTNSALQIGKDSFETNYNMNGWIDDFRVNKGVARYTGTFTPPEAEFADYGANPTGSTEPTWPTTPGNIVEDGGVTWTNMGQMVRPLMHGPLIAT